MWAYESVFYQIYPLGFVGAPFENDGVETHRILKVLDWIDHIKKLGTNAIYFSPVFESDTHGYNTRDYRKIDCRLGSNEDFKQVCDKLHSEGIRVVLDGVFNHAGRGFWAFQDVLKNRENSPYLNWFHINLGGNSNYNDGLWYEGWEGNYDLVKLNLQNEEVVQYLLERLDIPCIYVDGSTKGSTEGHAWDIVKIGQEYYYVDATNGDQPDFLNGDAAQLEEHKQIQVVEGIAKIESVSPTAIKIVEAEMSKKFSSIVTSTNVKVGGIDYVADVMNNLDRTSEKNIFDGLSEHDRDLADEIRKRMFVFEDIITMDDRSVQRFVRDCDPRDLVLSLKASNSEVANKLFSNMSTRMAQSIRDDLEITTNVRMKDVEEAQQRIVGIIRGLEEKGEIIILKGGKDDIIA